MRRSKLLCVALSEALDALMTQCAAFMYCMRSTVSATTSRRRRSTGVQSTGVHLRSLRAEATVASMKRTPRAPSSTVA